MVLRPHRVDVGIKFALNDQGAPRDWVYRMNLSCFDEVINACSTDTKMFGGFKNRQHPDIRGI